MKVAFLALFTLLYLEHSEGVYLNYYWRQYNGDIPNDAVPGGHDLHYRVTYIGQALAYIDGRYATIPSEIVADRDYNYFPISNHVIPIRNTIKILCATSAAKPKWIPTTLDNFFIDTFSQHLVKGGYESLIDGSKNYKYFIGRVKYADQLIVGKILIGDSITDISFNFVDEFEMRSNVTALEVLSFEN